MAVMGFFEDMNDTRLKPRLLRSLIKDCLPDEKRPFPSPADLSSVLSYVKIHSLLSEHLSQSSDRKLIDGWKSAVDAWVDHLLLLVSSKMPDKCWAGVCLLGVTCEECSSDRFLASYSLWFQRLLSNIQLPSNSHFVKVASCSSLADLFTRLAGFSNVKKDAISLAGKLIQPVLQLLIEDGSEAVWEGAIDLLCTILTFFPSTLHRHSDSAEAVIVSKIMSAKCNVNLSQKFACCLASLPKARGDEDSWSLMMQKILISINMILSDAFQGLEEEARSSETLRLLVPPGKDPPPPLGAQSTIGEASEQATKRFRELLVPRVSTLMQCCCLMLTNPYPVQVAIPVRSLLALIGRVLLVNGSLRESLLPFTTAMHQELLCSELPALHLDSLDLLIAVIKGVRSQILPHAANVVRLLTEYFRRAALPSIRVKVYSIMQILLISMGVGMALYLAQEVISNAFADLDDLPGSVPLPSNTYSSKVESEALRQSGNRKRKHASGSPRVKPNGVNFEVEALNKRPIAPLSVKIAALRALEALLTVGGSLRSECWRSNVDLLLITVGTNACDAGWASEGKFAILTEEPASTRADFQLAALQALLASLLSPARVRPPYLSQGLELFRRGKQETGTKLAAFCAHSLLALEVLIHPRSLPLVDILPAKSSTYDEGFNYMFPESAVFSGKKPSNNLDNDDLYYSWLGNGEETAGDASNPDKPTENAEEPVLGPTENILVEKHAVVDSASGHEVPEGSRDVEMVCSGREESSVELKKSEEQLSRGVGASADISMAPVEVFVPNGTGPGKGDVVSSDATDLSKILDASSKSSVVSNKGKETMMFYDSDAPSQDSLPDIVDADPDSD